MARDSFEARINSARIAAPVASYGETSRPNECKSNTRLASPDTAPCDVHKLTNISSRATVQGLDGATAVIFANRPGRIQGLAHHYTTGRASEFVYCLQ